MKTRKERIIVVLDGLSREIDSEMKRCRDPKLMELAKKSAIGCKKKVERLDEEDWHGPLGIGKLLSDTVGGSKKMFDLAGEAEYLYAKLIN